MTKQTVQNAADRAAWVKEDLVKAALQNPNAILSQYDNSHDGYDPEQVDRRRAEYGKNTIVHTQRDPLWRKIVDAFVNPFTTVLFTLAIISGLTDDIPAVVVVTVMVMISGVLRFVQEARSGKAAEKLSEMVETTVSVQRRLADPATGQLVSAAREIPLDELVVGDVVHLAAGDMIPADVRILHAKDLFVSQSSLTGESEPVEKFAQAVTGEPTNPLELNNLAFMGTNVVSGSATAVVLAVGKDTGFGAIAKYLQSRKTTTSFEKGVNSVSWVLIRFMLVMVPVVLFINGFTKGDWTEAFLFALSVAVGLTPEMLPMIVSANLAKGAVAMSRQRVIVKNLNSIQNLGAMDVLCTDKTGTLTQDRIILEYHLDIYGHEDISVLRHAFLNSHYQTGLKNLMDLSILERAEAYGVSDLAGRYRKIDEIPFDFNRRRMSVVVADQNGATQMITKGAIEEMLAVSSFVECDGVVSPLTDTVRAAIFQTSRHYNDDGLRVLGVALKRDLLTADTVSVADECDMVLIGYLAFLDPPKDSAKDAIAALTHYGVKVKVLTGDNDAVAKCVCRQVGLSSDAVLLGSDVDGMDDARLQQAVRETGIFAKLSPQQKVRIVTALRAGGHTVGFMGDGINDAPAMKAADVGISVDTAVDIAKESANIILLEKDLMVLERGVIEGRKTYANIIKYIKMTASSNFGNMFSVLMASLFLPFLPMLPIQILALNLIYDISCTTVPWDNVDPEDIQVPRMWDASGISRFMLWIGPTSSVFDITTYIFMFTVLCPMVVGGSYASLTPTGQEHFAALFQSGWFVESLWTQTLVIHMIRTAKIPFIHSRAAWPLVALTTLGIASGTVIPYTPLGDALGLTPLPWLYFVGLAVTILMYMGLVTAVKTAFIRWYGRFL